MTKQATNIETIESAGGKNLIQTFSNRYGVNPDRMLSTLASTCFKQKDNSPPVTPEQMVALLIVADQYHLNPFTKEIYAFPDKGGIVPIVGVDGWSRLLNENKEFDGIEFRDAPNIAHMDEHHKECPEWMECIIHRKDREHPTIVREYLDEVYRAPFVGKRGTQQEYTTMGPWQTHTKRQLRHKAMIQCARLAVGFTGIYDQDEAERIVEGSFTEVRDDIIVEPVAEKTTQQHVDEALGPEPTRAQKLKQKLADDGIDVKLASEIDAEPEELSDENKAFVADMEKEEKPAKGKK